MALLGSAPLGSAPLVLECLSGLAVWSLSEALARCAGNGRGERSAQRRVRCAAGVGLL